MTDVEWIKDLIRSEREMEEEGVVDLSPVINPEASLTDSTIQFLLKIKERVIDLSTAFNQLRGQALGGIKIYAISKTDADFMLFRNSYKLVFSAKSPGQISIRFQSQSVALSNPIGLPLNSSSQGPFNPAGASATGANTAASSLSPTSFDEDVLQAKWGAFGEISWTYDNLPVNIDYLVRYYLSRFIKESAK